MKIKIFLVDDHQMFIDGISSILEEVDGFEIVGSALNGFDALEYLKIKKVDVLITDISMPEMNGIELMRKITDLGIDIKVICLSMFNNIDYIDEMITAGAKGYLAKNTSAEKLVESIKYVFEGDDIVYSEEVEKSIVKSHFKSKSNHIDEIFGKNNLPDFTKRERELISEIASGNSNNDIAIKFGLSYHTITTHRRNIYTKMEVSSFSEFMTFVKENNLLLDI